MSVLEASGGPEGEVREYLTGRKKSRLKSIKSRLFGKIRGKEDDGGMKQSQSESDITFGVEDSDCSKGMMGSRAFSHDSIFQAEHSHSDTETLRILSQENIHGKIRALQMKLQQQKMHLGPPPLLLPKCHEDLGGSSEDGLPHSPTEGLYMSISNKPLSPRPISPAPLSPLAPGSVVDFSIPPQVTYLLDNTAAHYRMSLKPKNQRASAKRAGSRTWSESMNNLDHSNATKEDEKELALIKEIPRTRSYSSQVFHPGAKLKVTQMKSLPVSPLLSLQTDREDGRQVSTELELERNILSTSPSPTLKEMSPVESPVAKLPIPVVPIDRKGKGEMIEMLNSSELLKNSQSNPMSGVSQMVRPNVTTTPELNLVKDERKSNTVIIRNKIDIFSRYSEVNIENRQDFTHAPASLICGVNLRPSPLRRHVPFAKDKHESKSPHLISTELAVSQEETQTESIKRQRTVSGSFHFNVSTDKIQERPRTASFTGVFVQAGLKKEAIEPTKPTNFKIEHQVSSQEKTKDLCTNLPPSSKKEDKTDSDSVIPTKFNELSKSYPHALVVGDNENKEIRVEATEEQVHEVEVAEEGVKDVMEDATVEKEKETTNAFGVKLRSTSLSLKFPMHKTQSEDNTKRHSVEITLQTPPLASQSESTSCEDQHTGNGSIRVNTKLKDTPVQTSESSSSVLFSGSPPKSFCRDKERPGFLRNTELPQTSSSSSKDTKIVPSPPKEDTDLPLEEIISSSQQNAPTSTSSEVSWMEMAREKTRTLQQLFTSRLPEFPSLQSRPTTLITTQTQTQTFPSHVNPKITQNITNQPTATQPPLSSIETKQLPSPQHSGRSTQSTTHFPKMQTQTRSSQPLATQTTSPSQTDSTREAQFYSIMATKQAQPPVTCISNEQSINVQTSKLPSQTWALQTLPIPQSSPMQVASQTPMQAILRPTPPLHLTSSSKLTSQQSASTVWKDQPQDEGGEPTLFSGRSYRASVLQGSGTGPEDGRPMWAAGLGNKTSLVQHWESQTSATAKAGEQKFTSQSTFSLRPISNVSTTSTGFDTSLSTQASIFSGPMRSADREDKCQQNSVPPSSPSSSPSSSPLQSVRDSGQPSWMELAKRKSMAWSDKTMD